MFKKPLVGIEVVYQVVNQVLGEHFFSHGRKCLYVSCNDSPTCYLILAFSVQLRCLLDSLALFSTRPYLGFLFAPSFK